LVNVFFACNVLTAQSPLAKSVKTASYNSHYIICIDGGGSKTELQVIDSHGKLVALKQNNVSAYSIKSGGTNINVVGKDGVKNVLDALLHDLRIANTDIEVLSIAAQCLVVGGFSGAGRSDAKNTIMNLFKEFNFDENKIIISSDADMALESVVDNGIILISGTGSICLGKKGSETTVRVGGLGKVLGDEGSGYYIGLHALKAALEDEYGWGDATILKKSLQAYFKTPDLKSIIAPLNKGEMTNYQIAAIAPIVFAQAEMNDSIALNIINEAAQELGKMLACMVQKWKFSVCPIYFFGGTFKNKNADQFIQKILQAAHLDGWKTLNKSGENPTVIAVQNVLKGDV
jgi:N-acetylglucosamine kinase-like BadF-type ATPase